MSTDEYVPRDSEEWELVDLLGTVIEDVHDEPQFTVSEHALMAAGTIRREWLAAHDARIRCEAYDEGYEDGQHDAHEHRPWRKSTHPYRQEQNNE